jgi:hypothetical protein
MHACMYQEVTTDCINMIWSTIILSSIIHVRTRATTYRSMTHLNLTHTQASTQSDLHHQDYWTTVVYVDCDLR